VAPEDFENEEDGSDEGHLLQVRRLVGGIGQVVGSSDLTQNYQER
jgi:hypothetical protein